MHVQTDTDHPAIGDVTERERARASASHGGRERCSCGGAFEGSFARNSLPCSHPPPFANPNPNLNLNLEPETRNWQLETGN